MSDRAGTGVLHVAHPWFHAADAGGGVTRLWEPHVDQMLTANVWHVPGRDADLVVDAANGIGPLRTAIDALADGKPVVAFATHGHFDHVGGLHEFDDRRVHRDDADMTRSPYRLRLLAEAADDELRAVYAYYSVPMPDVLLRALPAAGFDVEGWTTPGAEPTMLLGEGDVIDLGDRRFTVLHTPGHTAGSACLFDESSGILFTGDALYVGARLDWEDPAAASRSLARIAGLDVAVAHAGHERSFDGAELRSACATATRDIEHGTT